MNDICKRMLCCNISQCNYHSHTFICNIKFLAAPIYFGSGIAIRKVMPLSKYFASDPSMPIKLTLKSNVSYMYSFRRWVA